MSYHAEKSPRILPPVEPVPSVRAIVFSGGASGSDLELLKLGMGGIGFCSDTSHDMKDSEVELGMNLG